MRSILRTMIADAADADAAAAAAAGSSGADARVMTPEAADWL
jgi:hypothetical protein